MKLRVQQARLAAALQQVQKAVSTRTTLPILSGIKFVATESALHLLATDLEIGIETWIPADTETDLVIESPGSIVLSAKYISELVRKLPDPWIDLQVEQPYTLRVRSGAVEYTLHGQDPEEFPRMPQLNAQERLTVQSDVFKDAIRQTIVAVATEDTRPVLTGISVSFDAESLTMVATDSHRLATRTLFLEVAEDRSRQQAVIPGKSMQELARLLPEDDSRIDIVFADHQMLVHAPHTHFYSRLLEGQYPDTSKIIPTTYKTRLHLNRSAFLGALERAHLIARDMQNHVVRLQVRPSEVEISTSSQDIGRVSEIIPVDAVEGEPLTIAFNAKYMLDAARAIDGEQVMIDFTGAMSPMILRPTDGQAYLHLVLPVRTV
ncbi:MAG: DNA polymerase III subunit beta [Alicyclobacillaceae bacterium]|nr:DNA polymerase III subunit beta [Alicyclobacillaceae bacterium]